MEGNLSFERRTKRGMIAWRLLMMKLAQTATKPFA